MGFSLKNILKSAKKVQNQNILEAIIAAGLLISASDGDIGKDETSKLEKLLANNDSLSSFKPSEVRKIIDKYSGILEADFRVGKLKLLKEIGDISDDADQSEEVFVNALAIAEASGDIDEKELAILKEIGRTLGVNLGTYGL